MQVASADHPTARSLVLGMRRKREAFCCSPSQFSLLCHINGVALGKLFERPSGSVRVAWTDLQACILHFRCVHVVLFVRWASASVHCPFGHFRSVKSAFAFLLRLDELNLNIMSLSFDSVL